MRTLYFCPVVSSSIFLFSSPNLSDRRVDVYHTYRPYTWCRLSANLECRSEMWCTRLAGNRGPTGRKNDAKKSPSAHHRTTLSGYIFQLRHVSTIGKNLLSSNISPTCPYNMVNFGPLAADIVLFMVALWNSCLLYTSDAADE